jgi:hypothetical protein
MKTSGKYCEKEIKGKPTLADRKWPGTITSKVFICTTGVNFTNILCTAFMSSDPKKAKKYSQAIKSFLGFWDLALKICT